MIMDDQSQQQPEQQRDLQAADSRDLEPRAKKRRRRPKVDRGLPPDAELRRLAEAYLKQQRKHWPELAERGLLPVPSEATLNVMVEDYMQRHRTGKVAADTVKPFREAKLILAGNYNRYSCDNSSPTSILDQMANVLAKARQEDRFVPWSYVFCDYSVSGLDATRQGYNSYKGLLLDAGHPIDTTNTKPNTPRQKRRNHSSRRCPKVLGYRKWVKYTARGFRSFQNFVMAIYFHCGALDMTPAPT